jgi:hypothetical protein
LFQQHDFDLFRQRYAEYNRKLDGLYVLIPDEKVSFATHIRLAFSAALRDAGLKRDRQSAGKLETPLTHYGAAVE